MLFFVAVISIIPDGVAHNGELHRFSSLMAGVVVELGAHKWVDCSIGRGPHVRLLFRDHADVTPPVGLASFAAAAISKADPLKTFPIFTFHRLEHACCRFCSSLTRI